MKKLLLILTTILIALLGYVFFTDIGVATCGLKDTINNCLDDKYEIGKKSTLNVNYYEGEQFSPNFVQRTTRNTNLQGGR